MLKRPISEKLFDKISWAEIVNKHEAVNLASRGVKLLKTSFQLQNFYRMIQQSKSGFSSNPKNLVFYLSFYDGFFGFITFSA